MATKLKQGYSFRQLPGMWACFLVLLAAAPAHTSPRVEIPEVPRNPESIPAGSIAQFIFPLRNRGDAPLTVEVIPSCGCTVAEYERTIEPGKEAVIHVKLDTKGLKGVVRKSLTVLTNDPQQKSVTLWVSALVETPIEIFPQERISFQAKVREVKSFYFILTSHDATPFAIVKAISPHAGISVECKPLAGKGEQSCTHYMRIDVRCDEAGVISGAIKIETTHPQAPNLEIAVSGMVRPRFDLIPSSASFGTVKADEKKEVMVLLVVEDGGRIKEVISDKPYVATSVESVEEGRVYLLHLAYTGGAPKGVVQGIVKLNIVSTARQSTSSPSTIITMLPYTATVE